jgi:Schlafen, AlbA_2
MSLFACAPADVTLERVRELVGQVLPESLTLEYKQRYSPSLVKSVGAMANTYGGLILVGVTDQLGPGRLAGVPEAAVAQIANACHETLEPPWEPEIIPVPLTAEPAGLYVLVIRVDPARAPRPLLLSGAAPIRLQGRNATADRARLAQLFSESPVPLRSAGRRLNPPDLATAADGSPAADFVIRTGLLIAVDDAATWRPLSERAVGLLADALNRSPLQPALLHWCTEMGISGCTPFHRSGFNRARHARLTWHGAVNSEPRHPVEAIAAAELPASYGAPPPPCSSHST